MSADVWWLASVRPAVRSSHRLEPASVHCSLYPVYCTVYSVVYSVHCTVHCTQNVFPVQSGSHSAPLEVLKGWAGPGDTVSPGWQGLHNWLQPGGWKGLIRSHKASGWLRGHNWPYIGPDSEAGTMPRHAQTCPLPRHAIAFPRETSLWQSWKCDRSRIKFTTTNFI